MKDNKLIKYLVITAFIAVSMTGCRSAGSEISSAQAVIDSISAQIVPDRRMGICDIKLKKSDGGGYMLSGETTGSNVASIITKALDKFSSKLIDSIVFLPDTSVTSKSYGLVTLSVINMRKLPAHSAELVSQSLLGTPVRILKQQDSWYLIQTPDNYLGWAEEASVAAMYWKEMDAWRHSARVIFTEPSGYIYSSADKEAVTGDFVTGCIMASGGEEKGMIRVAYPDGREGYVNSKFVMDLKSWKEKPECTGENIVRCASSFTGLPYLWGGSSIKAVDCSGLSKTVYYLNGVILLRDASQQALHGTNIDISKGYGQLRPGDLLFFGTKDKVRLHVTHVGIYEGDSEYINASGRVMVNSLDSTRSDYNSYRVTSLLLARRIIGVENDPGIVTVARHPWY